MAFRLQPGFEHARGSRRTHPASAPSPKPARQESRGWTVKRTPSSWFLTRPNPRTSFRGQITAFQEDPIKQSICHPYLHVFSLVGLFVSSLPAFLSRRGFLDVQVVAVDRCAAIEGGSLPQDHGGGVPDLQHVKTNRRTLEHKKR